MRKSQICQIRCLISNDGHVEAVQALGQIWATKWKSSQVFNEHDDNVELKLDLEDNECRELINLLSEVTLPEIYTLKVSNFYESDEDLENFLSNSVYSVSNLILITESFWIDVHDYLDDILKINHVKNLYLKGFLIDNEDCEKLFGSSNMQWVTLESWNLGIDQGFKINTSRSSPLEADKSALSKIRLIDIEIDAESITNLFKSISKTSLKDSLKFLEVINWELSLQDIKDVLERLNLHINVQ